MTKVLLLGYAPLPQEDPIALSALNLRTWHLARALGEDGHQVLLVALRAQGAYPDEEDLPTVVERELDHGIVCRAIRDRDFYQGSLLPRWVEQFIPQAIVAVGPRLGCRAAELETSAPLWADLYGYLMGEAQAAAYVFDDDSHLGAWHNERAVLERADVFSTCSLRQRYAVIGELGAVGRLGKVSAGYEFVHVMPSCIEPEPYQHSRSVLRDMAAGADDFVILFAGGYNTWTDVETLFDGVERAMRRNRHIRFVSTGGAIRGHDERTFARFQQLIQASPFADRFAFTGWVAASEVPNYYLEADAGVNADKFNYETVLGTRYRLNDMCKAGLPVITSLGTELSHELARAGIGLTFRIGDTAGLAEAILRLASDSARREEMGKRAARYALDHWHYAAVLQPLRGWAQDPTHAPDFGHPLAAAAGSAASFVPRSRLAQWAWLVEKEGYGGAIRRAAAALRRSARRGLRGAAQVVTVWLAQALLARRAVSANEAAQGDPQRVLLISGDDGARLGQAVAVVRKMLPQVEVTVLAGKREAGSLESAQGVRVVQPSAGWSARGLYPQARRLREEGFTVALVVGLGNRRAEVLAWLSGARVFAMDADGALYESTIAPVRALRAGAERAWSGLRWVICGALLGLVIIGVGAADAAAALGRKLRLRYPG